MLQYIIATENPYSWKPDLQYITNPILKSIHLSNLVPMQPYHIFLKGYIEQHTQMPTMQGQQPKTFYFFTKLSSPVICTPQGCMIIKIHMYIKQKFIKLYFFIFSGISRN